MKKNNLPPLGLFSMTLPADVRAEIEMGREAFKKYQKFKVIDRFSPPPLGTTTKQKMQDYRDRLLNGKSLVAKHSRGQPPMVARLRDVVIIVDYLESIGVPFGICENSKMNKLVRKFLHDQAELTTDKRKSRRKKITPGAVRSLLRQVRSLRYIARVFIQLPPYVEYSRLSQFQLPLSD
jgi:hypothetical protein